MATSLIQDKLVSIIIPTYNESDNILNLLDAIRSTLSKNLSVEIIIVDKNSPDGTRNKVEQYIQNIVNTGNSQNNTSYTIQQRYQNISNSEPISIKVASQAGQNGLVSAILEGIEQTRSNYVAVMDADFSHPPEMISKILTELQKSDVDIVVASRYVHGGSIRGWSIKRKLMSKIATKMSQNILGIKHVKDPMSGFFVFKRRILEKFKIATSGYKILLELLVKADHATVEEIPYAFVDRKNGASKLGNKVILDYINAVRYLYEFKRRRQQEQQPPQHHLRKRIQLLEASIVSHKPLSSFLSKAGKFFAVGASGLLINYLTCFLLSNGTLSSLWYVKATLIGILLSMTSNFLLNKIWTFKDKDFSVRHTVKQYGLYAAINSFGATIQLGLVYLLVESAKSGYDFALISAVVVAAIINFVLNKKWTFKERIWS